MDSVDFKTYKIKLSQLNEYAFSSNRSNLTLYVQTPLDFDLSISWLDNYLKSFVCDNISVLDMENIKNPNSGISTLPELVNSYSTKLGSSFYLIMDSAIQNELDRIEHYNVYINKPLSDGRPISAFALPCYTVSESIYRLSEALNKYGDIKVKYALFGSSEYMGAFKSDLNVNFKDAVLFNGQTGHIEKNNKELDFCLTPDQKDNRLIMHAFIGSVFVGVWYDKYGNPYIHFWRKDSSCLNESIFESQLQCYIDSYKKETKKKSAMHKILKFLNF